MSTGGSDKDKASDKGKERAAKKQKKAFYASEAGKKKLDNTTELVNTLLAKEVQRLKAKNETLKKKTKPRKKQPPTQKQIAQWNKFSARVARAKQIYTEAGVKSSEAWSEAMRKAKNDIGDVEVVQEEGAIDIPADLMEAV